MPTEVTIPPLGESITEASVGQWFKAPGDPVKADEPIVSLETDKVAVEVPSPVDGVMGDQLAKVGDTVAVGAVIARIDAASGAPAKAATPAVVQSAGEAKAAASAADTKLEPAAQPGHGSEAQAAAAQGPTPVAKAEASAEADPQPPSVRRIAAESGVDPAAVAGTGKDGRVTKDDMAKAAAAPPAPVAVASVGSGGGRAAGGRREERVRMTRIRQTIAKRLKQAQDTAAMLTTFNDVDMTAVMAARARYKDSFEKKHGVRLGFMSFFVKASVLALREVPTVNATIDGEEIVFRDYADISVAVSGVGGLVVPVLRDAQARSFADIEKTIGDFGKRAQAGTLTLAEMQGGTFTISNGGVFGSLMSTPILNPPQSGVLGLHRIEERAVVRDGQIVARPMMYLALSYDHRLVDGREAVTFLVRIKEAIEDPTRLLLDL